LGDDYVVEEPQVKTPLSTFYELCDTVHWNKT